MRRAQPSERTSPPRRRRDPPTARAVPFDSPAPPPRRGPTPAPSPRAAIRNPAATARRADEVVPTTTHATPSRRGSDAARRSPRARPHGTVHAPTGVSGAADCPAARRTATTTATTSASPRRRPASRGVAGGRAVQPGQRFLRAQGIHPGRRRVRALPGPVSRRQAAAGRAVVAGRELPLPEATSARGRPTSNSSSRSRRASSSVRRACGWRPSTTRPRITAPPCGFSSARPRWRRATTCGCSRVITRPFAWNNSAAATKRARCTRTSSPSPRTTPTATTPTSRSRNWPSASKHPNEAFKEYEALSREGTRPGSRRRPSLKAGLLAQDLDQNDTALALFKRAASLPGANAAVRADAIIASSTSSTTPTSTKRCSKPTRASGPRCPPRCSPRRCCWPPIPSASSASKRRRARSTTRSSRVSAQSAGARGALPAHHQPVRGERPNFVKEADDFLGPGPSRSRSTRCV